MLAYLSVVDGIVWLGDPVGDHCFPRLSVLCDMHDVMDRSCTWYHHVLHSVPTHAHSLRAQCTHSHLVKCAHSPHKLA